MHLFFWGLGLVIGTAKVVRNKTFYKIVVWMVPSAADFFVVISIIGLCMFILLHWNFVEHVYAQKCCHGGDIISISVYIPILHKACHNFIMVVVDI